MTKYIAINENEQLFYSQGHEEILGLCSIFDDDYELEEAIYEYVLKLRHAKRYEEADNWCHYNIIEITGDIRTVTREKYFCN